MKEYRKVSMFYVHLDPAGNRTRGFRDSNTMKTGVQVMSFDYGGRRMNKECHIFLLNNLTTQDVGPENKYL